MRQRHFSVYFGLVLATSLTIHVLPRRASVLLLVFAGVLLAAPLVVCGMAVGHWYQTNPAAEQHSVVSGVD